MLLRARTAACLACLLGACQAPPEPGAPPTPAGRLQRVFARDFGAAGAAAAWDRVARFGGVAVAEVRRTTRLTPLAGRIAGPQARAAAAAPQRAAAIAGGELARAGALRTPRGLVPFPDDQAGHLAAGLAALPDLLRLDRPPLAEPGDREHRTDPHDDRPEVSLWHRLARRIGL